MSQTEARQAYDKAVALHRQGRLAEAEQLYLAAAKTYPDHSGVLHGLGGIALRTRRFGQAVELLQRAAAAAPQNGAIRSDLGAAYLRLGRYEDAERCFEDALAKRSTDIGALIGLGDTLSILGRPEEARAAFEKATAIDPGHVPAQFGLGNIAMQLGHFAEARRAFARAVALAPKEPAYHRALAESARFRAGDARLAALEALRAGIGGMSVDQVIELHFALAKAYDDLERYDEAFAHLKAGNTLKRERVDYDEAAVAAFFGAIEQAFTPALMQARQGRGDESELPVFVVGLPRSGTTLVEQILASHPAVHGAGELLQVGELVAQGAAGPSYPADIASLPPAALRDFGRRYVARIAGLAPGAARIVDKLPANFRHLGLLHLALPRARIVHVRRDAADTCFSCYSKLFLNGLNYTYDLGELGRYHKLYDGLMAHWRAVLPPGAMLEMRYEDVVADLETQARRIVAFCGLEWDARCLAFQNTARPVRTLSQSQVRQGLYASAVGRWRHYERHLGPLLEALR